MKATHPSELAGDRVFSPRMGGLRYAFWFCVITDPFNPLDPRTECGIGVGGTNLRDAPTKAAMADARVCPHCLRAMQKRQQPYRPA